MYALGFALWLAALQASAPSAPTAAAPVTAAAPAPADAAVDARGAFIALSVPDLEASIAWYRRMFGLGEPTRPVSNDTVKVAILEGVGSSRVDLQACKLEYSIVSPK